MFKRIGALGLLVLASGCSFGPGNACDRYGFQRGTTAFAQCVQNEVLAQRQIYANNANSNSVPPRGRY